MSGAVVELVRHAAAHPREDWRGDDRGRPLDERGRRQAEGLAEALTGLVPPVVALMSSPTLRGRQTLEPLAARLDLSVQADEGFAQAREVPVTDAGDAWVTAAWQAGRALACLDELIAAHPEGRVVVCGHGETIPAVLALLAGRDELPLTDVRCLRAGRFTLTFEQRQCRSVVAADPPGRRPRRQDR